MKLPFARITCPFVFWRRLLAGLLLCLGLPAIAQDLAGVRQNGVLRHLGVPYARFVTGSGDGLDVEIVQLFAKHIGVRYEYVPTDWGNVIEDLIGFDVSYSPTAHTTAQRPIRGDIIGNGLTILQARKNLVDFSLPTFPSAVWLLARADSAVQPIVPSGNLPIDIQATKEKIALGPTFVLDNSCLDPRLYGLENKGLTLLRTSGASSLNDLVPAMLKGGSEMTLLDVPDVIVAMEKWPGQIKVIGPISEEQQMAAGFRKTSPQLRQAFDDFLVELKKDGTYMQLVRKYYRSAPRYLPEFFRKIPSQ